MATTERIPASPVDARSYRQVLGNFVSGVAIITGTSDSGPVGLAVNSFASVSLEPPLISFCPASSSSSWPRIRAAGRFCVNILSSEQEVICRRFAQSGPDKFAGLAWRAAPSGAPILDRVLAWIDCSVECEQPAGDHTVVLGRVHALGSSDGGSPLAFHRGGYGRFLSAV